MTQPISRRALRFSNRKRECELFRRILHYETPLRGLVIHSGGEGGLGKSTLLIMFEDECKIPDLPVPTTALYFNADRLVNWQDILDRTVDVIGEERFQEYAQLRARYNAATKDSAGASPTSLPPTSIHHEVHFHAPVHGPLHTGSGNIEIEQSAPAPSGFDESLAGGYSAETRLSPEQARVHLTQVFLQALNAILQPLQVVWLVDTAEKLDDITKTWLIDVFWRIADGETARLALVVAGRERLRYEPHWMEKVAEMLIHPFSEDIIIEILQESCNVDNIGLLKLAAMGLIKESGGRPLEVIMQIESHMSLRGGSYV